MVLDGLWSRVSAMVKWVVDWSEAVAIVGTGVRCCFSLGFVGGGLV